VGAAFMTMPFTFPDWMPWWLQLLTVVVVLLLGLALVVMPFSVFGVKSRLETIEARLDEIQSEIRSLAQRLPEPGREPYTQAPILRASPPLREPSPRDAAPRELSGREPIRAAPPIPPASWEAEPAREAISPTLRAAARVNEAARERSEPRFGRPRPDGQA